MLRFKDRHEREMLYGPTAEEVITAIFRDSARSYRDLPRTLYNIQWKFRDEVRPRFGVMRGREFLMKDAYSFDLDEAGARHSYNRMFVRSEEHTSELQSLMRISYAVFCLKKKKQTKPKKNNTNQQ